MILNHEEGISISPKAKIGYFAQNGYKYNSNQNVMEFMQKDCDYNISEIPFSVSIYGVQTERYWKKFICFKRWRNYKIVAC